MEDSGARTNEESQCGEEAGEGVKTKAESWNVDIKERAMADKIETKEGWVVGPHIWMAGWGKCIREL